MRDHGADMATIDILLYDIIGEWWGGGVSSSDFVRALAELGDDDHVRLRINSPGGDAAAGVAIRNALASFPGKTTAIVEGQAASAASVAMVGADRVIVAPGARVMIHRASAGFMAYGNADDILRAAGEAESMAASLELLDGEIADLYTRRAVASGRGEPPADIAADFAAKMASETWFNGTGAVEAGIADEIADNDPRPVPADARKRAAAAAAYMLPRYQNVPREVLAMCADGQCAASELVIIRRDEPMAAEPTKEKSCACTAQQETDADGVGVAEVALAEAGLYLAELELGTTITEELTNG